MPAEWISLVTIRTLLEVYGPFVEDRWDLEHGPLSPLVRRCASQIDAKISLRSAFQIYGIVQVQVSRLLLLWAKPMLHVVGSSEQFRLLASRFGLSRSADGCVRHFYHGPHGCGMRAGLTIEIRDHPSGLCVRCVS